MSGLQDHTVARRPMSGPPRQAVQDVQAKPVCGFSYTRCAVYGPAAVSRASKSVMLLVAAAAPTSIAFRFPVGGGLPPPPPPFGGGMTAVPPSRGRSRPPEAAWRRAYIRPPGSG